MFHIIGKLIRFIIGLVLLAVLSLIVARTYGFSVTDISNKFSGIISAVETKQQQAVDVVDKTKTVANSVTDTFSKITEALDSLKKIAGLSSSTIQKTDTTSSSSISTTPTKQEPTKENNVKDNPNSSITVDSIIELTNAERQKAGKSKLAHNTKLDMSAQLKVNDLFTFQYFEHTSPKGTTTVDLAKAVGYTYRAIGENLAGGFSTSKEVVDAWMKSPGHRANILSDNYTEIGVAIKKGMFKGDDEWLAVQEFGKQAANCTLPNTTLKASIDQSQGVVVELNTKLDELKKQLETMDKSSSQYQSSVATYNSLVDQFNTLIAQRKAQVEQYNIQVNTYNICNL